MAGAGMPLVSVVLPAYNHERWLGEAIGSVLAQTEGDWELIVIDDGSRDRSLEVARGFADPRITVLAQDNAGAHAALNRGLGLARGRYAAILNSDDRWRPRRLERLLAAAARTPGEALWFTDLAVIDAWGRLDMGDSWAGHIDLRGRCAAWPLRRVLRRGNLAHTTSNFFAPTGLFRRLGGMRALRYVHDWDFLLRALRQARVERLPETLLDYRVHDTNTIREGARWRHLAEASYVAGVHLLDLLDEDGVGTDPGAVLDDVLEGVVGNPCFPAAMAQVFRTVARRCGEDEALRLAADPAAVEDLARRCTGLQARDPLAMFPTLAITHWLASSRA